MENFYNHSQNLEKTMLQMGLKKKNYVKEGMDSLVLEKAEMAFFRLVGPDISKTEPKWKILKPDSDSAWKILSESF